MLLPLLLVCTLRAVASVAALHAATPEDKHSLFAIIPELDSQAVRDAWIRLEREAVAASEKKSEPESSMPPLGVIGVVEPVFIEDIPLSLPARVDTGASLCSIDVEILKHFERDGKPWVSFAIKPRGTGKKHIFERRVLRTINIKQQGREAILRPLVNMKVRIGDMTVRREFTLANRHNYTYQVLLGRNLLQGLALVDVSTSNTLR